jgi:hypothetical protein
LGVGILLVTWITLYLWESIFTESRLVGYYCCVNEQDLPAPGTIERTLGDYFRETPGKHLLALTLVSVNAAIFVLLTEKATGARAPIPIVLALLNAVYLFASAGLVLLSVSVTERIGGPATGPYQGYNRTWYDIALHLVLVALFFFALTRVSRWLISRAQMGEQW